MGEKTYLKCVATLLLSSAVCCSALAEQNGDPELDLVLKCTGDRGNTSWIVNLRSKEGFFVWDTEKGLFSEKAACKEYIMPLYHSGNGGYQGFTASCEMTPTTIKMERRWQNHGFSSPDRDYATESFHVDRTNGHFRWVKNPWGGTGETADITGTCSPTERPQPPATKF